MSEDIRKYIEEEYKRVFGEYPPKEITDRLVEEYYRLIDEYKYMGFTEEEAKVIARGTIREGIRMGRGRLV